MKNYFKFIVAVAAIMFATFGSISTASAKRQAGSYPSTGHCSGGGCCGKTALGNNIDGTYHSDGCPD